MVTWFGVGGEELARELDLPQVTAVQRVGSTMDAAHALAAAGAPAGTLVIAEEQQAGRGRGGRVWRSSPRAGIWMTLLERPRTAAGLDVLSLRVGLRLAPVLERWTTGPVSLKWPNDLFVGQQKLAGVLIEARWRGARADWVAIGVGINLVSDADEPDEPEAGRAGLVGVDARLALAEILPAVRAAAFATGPLTASELAGFADRDLARGQLLSAPTAGTARGISAAGELLVETASGVTLCRAGSLVLAPL
jgi:BirA family biotin operon repressor/biotin-[acetyl-CoA-carboxylase] ligase